MTDPQTPASPTRVFLSYARGDDEPFVTRLHADLQKAGFTVWFDRESLMSRGLSFHQEIKDAIRTEVDRVVYIGGPQAALSAYVREEWQFALECDHVVVTPILRLGEYVSVPGELSLMHCEDFRDDAQYGAALAKLTASLRLPNPKLGALFAVPNLPPNFLGRPEMMRRVRDALLVDLQKPQVISGADAHVGMQGMGGIGKSVLAAALARNRQAREAYPDGVAWIACGQNLADDDLLKRQRDLARHLGGDDTFASLAQGQSVLRQLLAAKAVLLVLDDVWRAADAQALDVLGPRCRMLVTTRDKGILDTIHGELVPVSLFTETEALHLLAGAVNIAVPDLPAEAREVVSECGFLPLALALCGGMAKSGHAWSEIVGALREADLEWPENREAEEQHRTIWNAMKASYDALPDQEKSRFAELAAFVTDRAVPEAAAATLWEHTGGVSKRNAAKLLINLAQRSLVQLDQQTDADNTVRRRFRLHDLLYDYAARVAGDPRSAQLKLLDAYRRQCPGGWPFGPNDGYFLQHLVDHLLAASSLDDALALLTDIPWIEAKCRVGLVFDLLRDYRAVSNALPETQERLEAERSRQETAVRYAAELVAYASAWSAIRGGTATTCEAMTRRFPPESGYNADVRQGEPALPVPPPTCRMLTEGEIQADCDRIIDNPTRVDRLDAFCRFVSSQCYRLLEFGGRPGFTRQHGLNWEPAGPVRDAASALVDSNDSLWLERMWPTGARLNPKSAELLTLKVTSGWNDNVRITPDGRRAVSCSKNDTLRVWDLENGGCLRTLEGHSSDITSLSITPDGQCAVSGSKDGTIRVWDLESGTCLRVLEAHGESIGGVSITPDGRRALSGSWDTMLRVWDLERGTCLRTLEGHSNVVTSVSITPDGRRAVSGSWDTTLRVWDLESGACLRALKGQNGMQILCVSVTPDGRLAVSTSRAGDLAVWDLESGTCLHTLGDQGVWGGGVSVTPDGRRAVSGSKDHSLRVWDLESGACLRTLEGHFGDIASVSITPDGHRAASSSSDATLRVWNLESGACLRTIEGHSGKIQSVSVTSDGRRAVSGSEDHTLRVWDLESGICLRVLEGHSDGIMRVGVTPDGCRAVSYGWDATLRVWDLESGASVHTLEGHSEPAACVRLTPDGRRAVSGSWDGTLRVWDLESGTCLRVLEGHSDNVLSLSITPDDQCAVSGSKDGTIRVWDLESGTCLRVLEAHGESIKGVSITPDGRRALSNSLSSSWDTTLRVWDLERGTCLRTLEGHSNVVTSVSITPDGRRAVSGSLDTTLRVWDLESGACLRTLEGHSSEINSLSITPDGRRAVSGSWDRTLRVWDLESGACIGAYCAADTVAAVTSFDHGAAVCLATGKTVLVLAFREIGRTS